MSEQQQVNVDIDGAAIHVTGDEGEEVTLGPTGIHVKDGEDEVNVRFSGIHIKDGRTNIHISVWKPLLLIGATILVFAALLTAVIVGIIKLMM
jgi:hypothetical protein